MTRPRRKKSTGVCRIYRDLLERLPNTYPQPSLVVHSSLSELYNYYWSDDEKDPGDPGHPPFAFCDGSDDTIHVSVQLNREPRESIVWYYLHELGHLYALHKYGEKDKRWSVYTDAECYANRFASRWLSRLKKERWI